MTLAPRHLALVGPTASGKSAVALAVAERLADVEILSADSMQVYRGMDLGTAKPSPAERARVPHHLLDVAEPDEPFTVARFQREAAVALAAIEQRGRRALLVGGTGLYVQAVVDRLRIPGRYPDVRAVLEAEPDTVALHRRLAGLDPIAAARMEPTNRRRVVRALEVTIGSGRPFSEAGPGIAPPTENLPGLRPVGFRMAGLWLPRATVNERIETRYREQLAAGFLEEVSGLRGRLGATASQALGYRELLAHLEGEGTLDEAVAEAVRRTKAIARRQRMWFRRDPRITWLGSVANPFAAVDALVREWA